MWGGREGTYTRPAQLCSGVLQNALPLTALCSTVSSLLFVCFLVRLAVGAFCTCCVAVVSDAGSGGQVLLDSVTFGIIKDRLEELGQVCV